MAKEKNKSVKEKEPGFFARWWGKLTGKTACIVIGVCSHRLHIGAKALYKKEAPTLCQCF